MSWQPGGVDFHTWNLELCLQEDMDLWNAMSHHPEDVQGFLKGRILQSFFRGEENAWPEKSMKSIVQMFLQGSLTAEAKDIRWWVVEEENPVRTTLEDLAIRCGLAGKGDLLINSIPDWVNEPRVRIAKTGLASFCREATRMIMEQIDWKHLEKSLRGE